MTWVALGAALLALFVALGLRGRLASLGAGLDEARREGRRAAENLREEVRAELQVTRRLLAMTAEGRPPSPDMIEEGRLWRDVDAAEAQRLVESGEVHVLDVRTADEVRAGILPGARHVPMDAVEQRLGELPDDGRPTLVYCAAGGRSAAVCELLAARTRLPLLNLAGGIGAWRGPLERT